MISLVPDPVTNEPPDPFARVDYWYSRYEQMFTHLSGGREPAGHLLAGCLSRLENAAREAREALSNDERSA